MIWFYKFPKTFQDVFLHPNPERIVLPFSEILWKCNKRLLNIFLWIRENKEKQIKIIRDYFLKFAKFLRTTVECHDTKAENPGIKLFLVLNYMSLNYCWTEVQFEHFGSISDQFLGYPGSCHIIPPSFWTGWNWMHRIKVLPKQNRINTIWIELFY